MTAGFVYDRVAQSVGSSNVFFDVDTLPVGESVEEVIRQHIRLADIVLVIIGPSWDNKKLFDQQNWVRFELTEALGTGTPVVPVVVDDASVPLAEDLPSQLRPAISRNAAIVRPAPDFERDAKKLLDGIRAIAASRVEPESTDEEQGTVRRSSFSRLLLLPLPLRLSLILMLTVGASAVLSFIVIAANSVLEFTPDPNSSNEMTAISPNTTVEVQSLRGEKLATLTVQTSESDDTAPPLISVDLIEGSELVQKQYLDLVVEELVEIWPLVRDDIYGETATIQTTLDSQAQANLLLARDRTRPVDSQGFEIEAITIDSRDGAIRAWIGPTDATPESDTEPLSPRPIGAITELFVALTAFEQGISPDDWVRADAPCDLSHEAPSTSRNYGVDGDFEPPSTIGQSLIEAKACAMSRVAEFVGPDNVAELARRAGVVVDTNTTSWAKSAEVTLVELSGAVATVANEGRNNKPWAIDRLLVGPETVFERGEEEWTRAVATNSGLAVAGLLLDRLTHIASSRAYLLPSTTDQVGGIGGVTATRTDDWFVGFSRYYTTAVWLGDPNGDRPLENLPGYAVSQNSTSIPFEVWRIHTDFLHRDLLPTPFPVAELPEGSRYLSVDSEVDFCSASETLSAFLRSDSGTVSFDESSGCLLVRTG